MRLDKFKIILVLIIGSLLCSPFLVKAEQMSADQMVENIVNSKHYTEKLELSNQGYRLYPGDTRFVDLINSSAFSLMVWAENKHKEEEYEVVRTGYNQILTSSALKQKTLDDTKHLNEYAKRNLLTPEMFLEKIASNGHFHEKLELGIEGYSLYPNDNRFVDSINNSANRLLSWAKQKHNLSEFEISIDRYKRILDAPMLETSISQETLSLLKLAEQNHLPPEIFYEKILQNIHYHERLALSVEGYSIYNRDKRFEEAINNSADKLLIWSKQKHKNHEFEIAIDRYEQILAAHSLHKSLETEVKTLKGYADQNKLTPDMYYEYAIRNIHYHERLILLIEGSKMYPSDTRYEGAINVTARALLAWTKPKHNEGQFELAVDRYNLLLKAPKLQTAVIKEIIELKSFAEQQKIPSNMFYDNVIKQKHYHTRLELAIEGYHLYPGEIRFEQAINSSAKALLAWTNTKHMEMDYSIAVERYNQILSAPKLQTSIKNEVQYKKKYADNSKQTPEQYYDYASNQFHFTDRLTLFSEGYKKYSAAEQVAGNFVAGTNASAQALLNWARAQHQQKNFDVAINRYKMIIHAPNVENSILLSARNNLSLAEKGLVKPSVSKVVNPKVQNYTYVQMLKDMRTLEAMYPNLITTTTIGRSLDGRDIYAIKLGNGKTEVLFNGSAHAREHMNTNLLMKMIDEYAYAYANGSNIDGFNVKQVLDRTSMWFVPMNNPDGVTLVQLGPDALSSKIANNAIKINGGSRNFSSWKANARGVDLNRNYPTLWKTVRNDPGRPSESHYKGPTPLSEPESQVMYKFILSKNFKTLVDYHSSGEVLYARKPGHIENVVSKKTGYSIIDETFFTSGGDLPTWYTLEFGLPGLTPEISPYVGPRPVPVANWDSIWRKNHSVGLIVADEAYRNRRTQ